MKLVSSWRARAVSSVLVASFHLDFRGQQRDLPVRGAGYGPFTIMGEPNDLRRFRERNGARSPLKATSTLSTYVYDNRRVPITSISMFDTTEGFRELLRPRDVLVKREPEIERA